jgi:hypothetical protein
MLSATAPRDWFVSWVDRGDDSIQRGLGSASQHRGRWPVLALGLAGQTTTNRRTVNMRGDHLLRCGPTAAATSGGVPPCAEGNPSRGADDGTAGGG